MATKVKKAKEPSLPHSIGVTDINIIETTFKWVVNNFSFYQNGFESKLSSPVFETANNKNIIWSIDLDPNPSKNFNNLSLNLKLVQSELPQICATFEFSIINKDGTAEKSTTPKNAIFYKGISKSAKILMSKGYFQKNEQKILPNDTLTLLCKIKSNLDKGVTNTVKVKAAPKPNRNAQDLTNQAEAVPTAMKIRGSQPNSKIQTQSKQSEAAVAAASVCYAYAYPPGSNTYSSYVYPPENLAYSYTYPSVNTAPPPTTEPAASTCTSNASHKNLNYASGITASSSKQSAKSASNAFGVGPSSYTNAFGEGPSSYTNGFGAGPSSYTNAFGTGPSSYTNVYPYSLVNTAPSPIAKLAASTCTSNASQNNLNFASGSTASSSKQSSKSASNAFGAGPSSYTNVFGAGPSSYTNGFGAGPSSCTNAFGAGPSSYTNAFGAGPSSYTNAYTYPSVNTAPPPTAEPAASTCTSNASQNNLNFASGSTASSSKQSKSALNAFGAGPSSYTNAYTYPSVNTAPPLTAKLATSTCTSNVRQNNLNFTSGSTGISSRKQSAKSAGPPFYTNIFCQYCDHVLLDCRCNNCKYCKINLQYCRCKFCKYCKKHLKYCRCDFCEYCYLRHVDCECIFCDHCGEHVDDCDCDYCDDCCLFWEDCECDFCEHCGDNREDCDCPYCPDCDRHLEDCFCDDTCSYCSYDMENCICDRCSYCDYRPDEFYCNTYRY